MGNHSSVDLSEELVASIEEETGFTPKQIGKLYKQFRILDKDQDDRLTKDNIRSIPNLHKNPMLEHVVHAVFKASTDGDFLTFREFARVMATFRPLKKNQENIVNSREEKLKFAFSMYDFDDTGYIDSKEIEDLVHIMVGRNVSEKTLKSLCDRARLEADIDKDGQISFQEFKEVLRNSEIEVLMSIRFS